MRRFRFSLDVLLRLRRRRERSARQQAARSRARCEAALAEVERIQSAIVRQDRWGRQALEDQQVDGFVGLAFYRELAGAMRTQLARRNEELLAAQERAHHDRAALLEAIRRRQVMDRLRARRLREHQAAANRLETAEREGTYRSDSAGLSFRQDFRTRLLGGVPLPGPRKRLREVPQ